MEKVKKKTKLCYGCEEKPVREPYQIFCSQRCAADFGISCALGDTEVGVAWCTWHGWWPPSSENYSCSKCDNAKCERCQHRRDQHDKDEGCQHWQMMGEPDCHCVEFQGLPRGDEGEA